MNTIKALKNEVAVLKEEINRLKSELSEEKNHENRFRTIFESSQLSNKVITPDLQILQVNQAMVELLGYDSKKDIIGTEILDYSPPDYQKHWAILQKELWEKETPYFNLETCLIKKDGSLVWCHVTSILFKDDKETLGYTILEDITEQYHQKLRKEEFITMASHELKTPITSLKAGLQLMNRLISSEKDFPPKISQLSKNAEMQTAKLIHLVGDLLNLSNFEQGEMILNKTDFMLSEIVQDCTDYVRLEDKYSITLRGDHSLKMCADKYKIEQVLVNLVNNAIKYAPETKEIVIKAESLKTFTRVSVIDQGEGIPAENIPHLFERYYRANKKSKSSGLGLGLYISAEIIKNHDGEIGVKSKV